MLSIHLVSLYIPLQLHSIRMHSRSPHNALHSPSIVRNALLRMRARGRDACTCAVRSSRVGWMADQSETSRSTPAYSEPWMRRERINVSVHSIYTIVCRSPRQTKRLDLRCLSNFCNILCPFHLIILTQCYLLREAYVCALCVYLVSL